MTQEDLDLAEKENSNLRKHLLWCAQFLNADQRKELAVRLNTTIEKGGVVGDQEADDRKEELDRDMAIETLTDTLQRAIDNGKIHREFESLLDLQANRLRGYIVNEKELTMYELKGGDI